MCTHTQINLRRVLKTKYTKDVRKCLLFGKLANCYYVVMLIGNFVIVQKAWITVFQPGNSHLHPTKVVFVVAALCSQAKTISALLEKYSLERQTAPNEDIATDRPKEVLMPPFSPVRILWRTNEQRGKNRVTEYWNNDGVNSLIFANKSYSTAVFWGLDNVEVLRVLKRHFWNGKVFVYYVIFYRCSWYTFFYKAFILHFRQP